MLRWIVILFVICTLTGCRGTRKSDMWQSILDAEKRALEDRMAELEVEVATLEDKLDSTRRENDTLRSEREKEDLPAPRRRATTGSSESLDSPMIELNNNSSTETYSTSSPVNLNAATGNGLAVPAREAATTLGALNGLGSLTGEQAPEAPATDRVVSIHLNPMLTGGDDTDNRPGDEGISVVIEPRNVDDAYVPQAGRVSVVVLDPAKQGPSARVARWDFDIGEARSRLKKSALGRGLHFSIPWPNKPPENDRLHLFVRYTTADGRRLEADREIRIDLKSKLSARWTPAVGGRGAPAIVAGAAPTVAPVSPYVANQQGPLPQPPVSQPPVSQPPAPPTDSLEERRIDVAHREAADQPKPTPARKLKRPVWIPQRN